MFKLFKTEGNLEGFECLTLHLSGQATSEQRSTPLWPSAVVKGWLRSPAIKRSGVRKVRSVQLITGQLGFALVDQVPKKSGICCIKGNAHTNHRRMELSSCTNFDAIIHFLFWIFNTACVYTTTSSRVCLTRYSTNEF